MKNFVYISRIIISLLVFIFIVGTVVFYIINPLTLPTVDYWKIAIWTGIFLFIFFILFGRLGCSLVCPFGIIQDFVTLFFDRMNEKQSNWFGKYIIMVLCFILTFAGVFIYQKNPNILETVNVPLIILIMAGVLLVTVAILSAFKDRFFCTHICPCGTFVGLISKFSIFKMYMDKSKCVCCGICERSCPSCSIDACEESIDNETCVKCLKCFAKCPKGAISLGIVKKDKE